MLNQVLTGRRVFLEGTRRADVVGCNHVTQNGQYFSPFDVGDYARLCRHVLEIWRVLNVGRRGWPVVGLGVCCFDRLPLFVAFEYVGVFFLEGFARHGLFNQFSYFLCGWPDVAQINIIAVLILTQRCMRQIDVHVTHQCIGHNQWR